MRLARISGLLDTGLKGLIAGILSRPYRAQFAFRKSAAAVAAEIPWAEMKAEIESLPEDQRLADGGGLRCYCARPDQIPWTLQEIGRLRELTFRAVGEGTGRCSDIDLFDAYYLHLFVWDPRANAIAGAYRLGFVDDILARRGKLGLYSHSLFEYRDGLLESLNPAIELGRSFVRNEYQRSYAPLLLLWRGIARIVARSPRYAVLFGPVSISSSYAPASRRLIVDFISACGTDAHLANQVRPRRPYCDRPRILAPCGDAPAPKDIDELSRRIESIEQDHKGVPVLLKQYLRLGGRVLAFSVDEHFADTLDGLIMVDLRHVEPAVLARYMGKVESVAFRAHHALDPGMRRRAP